MVEVVNAALGTVMVPSSVSTQAMWFTSHAAVVKRPQP
jgi:hypothetical protein